MASNKRMTPPMMEVTSCLPLNSLEIDDPNTVPTIDKEKVMTMMMLTWSQIVVLLDSVPVWRVTPTASASIDVAIPKRNNSL